MMSGQFLNRTKTSFETNQPQQPTVLKTLALAYYFTGNTQYADHACEQLNAWMLDPQLLMLV